jgi:hypothetical protein
MPGSRARVRAGPVLSTASVIAFAGGPEGSALARLARRLAVRLAFTAGLLGAVTLAARAQCVTNAQPIDNSGAGLVTGLLTVPGGCIVNSGAVSATETAAGGTAITLGIPGPGSITNSGTATAIGQAGTVVGVVVVIDGNIVNSGAATGTGGAGSNVSGLDDGAGSGSIANSGTVTTAAGAGGSSKAIVLGAGTVSNSGSATATVAGSGLAAAILINGNGSVVNSGSATATSGTAGGAFAVLVGGSGTIINTGSATATGATNSAALSITGASSTVINAGAAIAPNGAAILLQGNASTLTLLPGSFVVGPISLLGTGDTVNVDVANQNLTISSLAGPTVTSNLPFVVVGDRVATIDPTPFALADKTLMDFTRGISGILDGIGGGAAPSGPLSSAFAPSGGIAGTVEDIFASFGTNPALGYANDAAPVFKAPTLVTRDGRAVWARGFGGERSQDADGVLTGAHTSFFGGAVGFDMVARSDLRLGLFAGGGESRLTLDGNGGFTHTDTGFGGLYGRWSFASFGHASFLDFALHGGGSNNSTQRTVNNNLAPGGLETATASYASAYISPELKYGVNVPLWAQYTLTPSLSVRYVAGFFGGYTESGTTAPLTVAGRTTQDLEERGELKLTHLLPAGSDLLLTSVHVGAIGLERVGDTTVNTVLLGASLPFVTPGKNEVAGVLGGGGFEWRTRQGVSLFGAAEAIGFSDQSTVWSAKGGVRVAF